MRNRHKATNERGEIPPGRETDFPEEKIANPFGAPVFYKPETESTMLDAHEITKRAACSDARVLDGTVAAAGFQKQGRGRLAGRKWLSKAGENLVCTSIFTLPVSQPFTLRVGLAVARTFDRFIPEEEERTRIKWPNDVLFQGKKLSGILCESDGAFVYAGTGLNIAQKEFPDEIKNKASSLAVILNRSRKDPPALREVLEVFLAELKNALDEDSPWETDLHKKIYKLGEAICFLPGTTQAGVKGEKPKEALPGVIRGIEKNGGLILETDGGMRTFFSGEIFF